LVRSASGRGGSIGVSIVSNVLTHREQFHQNRLVEQVIPSSVQYQDTLHRVTDYFVAQRNSLLQAQQQAVQWIGQQVQALVRSPFVQPISGINTYEPQSR
jgi:DHA2 family multidrug resistance protein